MNSIKVSLKDRSYDIHIHAGLHSKLPEILGSYNDGQTWVLFTQQPIFDLYGSDLMTTLCDAEFKIHNIILENSEEAKSLSSMESIYSQLIKFGADLLFGLSSSFF